VLGQSKDLESFGDCGLHPVAQIGCALAIFFDECFEFGFCVLKSVGIEDRAYVGADGFAHVEREHEIVRTGIGRKFQTPSIYEKLTVFENLEISYPFGRTVFGSLRFSRTEEVVTRICEVAEEIFLKDYLELPAELLSHGQKQWLEIGMLIVQDPELVMLDEPVAGMTAKERDATAILLRKVAKQRSIIIIEHDMDFVAKIADRVTVLHLGKIIKEGTMAQVQSDQKVKEVYLGH
jgi:urea transport system ATP-binding protein